MASVSNSVYSEESSRHFRIILRACCAPNIVLSLTTMGESTQCLPEHQSNCVHMPEAIDSVVHISTV
jgi:hypothetical protein